MVKVSEETLRSRAVKGWVFTKHTENEVKAIEYF